MLSKEPVLFVSEIAGIGKSEFVKYFAEKYAKKYTNIIYWFYTRANRNFRRFDLYAVRYIQKY